MLGPDDKDLWFILALPSQGQRGCFVFLPADGPDFERHSLVACPDRSLPTPLARCGKKDTLHFPAFLFFCSCPSSCEKWLIRLSTNLKNRDEWVVRESKCLRNECCSGFVTVHEFNNRIVCIQRPRMLYKYIGRLLSSLLKCSHLWGGTQLLTQQVWRLIKLVQIAGEEFRLARTQELVPLFLYKVLLDLLINAAGQDLGFAAHPNLSAILSLLKNEGLFSNSSWSYCLSQTKLFCIHDARSEHNSVSKAHMKWVGMCKR